MMTTIQKIKKIVATKFTIKIWSYSKTNYINPAINTYNINHDFVKTLSY
jgi:hypothetical protein